ncbi:MAG: YlxR family protein [Nitrospinota bacterium]|nr:YlxR family protein [Nitrospinota bacterium]MDP7168862.1 YlxR family protein [Nitrospinota bacterium]MDP7370894.1 YlxR family protein [Nitrospinota bacterium]MDP7503677.1 YlxR family protein [Nitrospinota bacterium]MDP7664817.1 YlxR family protein [Nitrospinota bacterium]
MPERMCIACRKKAPPGSLFRMVAGPGGEVYAELDSRLPGRGAYCCFGTECLSRTLEPGNLTRALRSRTATPAADEIAASLRSLLGRRIEGLLGAAWRKKVISAGRDAALRAARPGGGGRLFLAEDLAAGSREEVLKRASLGDGTRAPAELNLTMERVGAVFGGRPVGVFFLADSSLARQVALRSSQVSALAPA